MQITRVTTLCLSRTHEPAQQWFTATTRTMKADAALVVIETDAGLSGVGEASPYGGPQLIREWVERLSHELIGRDPGDPSLVLLPNGQPVAPGFPFLSAYDCAVAGLDCALWDLRGKIAGQQVCKLLRPDAPTRVRLYASSGCRYDWGERPEQLIEEVLSYAAQGYTAAKVRLGTDWRWHNVTVERFLGLMRDLTNAVAGRLELMLDGNQRLTEEQALPIARELDRLGFAWFEEPLPISNIAAYTRLNAAVQLPISGGEGFTTLQQCMPYFEQKALDIIQCDVACCGITEIMRIARAAERYGIALCPHSWHNGAMALANAQVVAAAPNSRILELCMIQGPLQWEILAEKPTIREGWLELPAQPGLGITLAHDLERLFPYQEGHYAIEIER